MIRPLGLVVLWLFVSCVSWATWKVDLSQVPADVRESLAGTLETLNLERMSLIEVDDLVKLIHLTAQYDPVTAVEVSNGLVEIRLQRRPRIRTLEFEGLRQMTPAEVRRYITVQEGDVFDPQLLQRQAESLQDAMKSLGYINAEVDVEFPEAAPGLIDLKIVLRPGVATRIQQIQLKMTNSPLRVVLRSQLSDFEGEILTENSLREIQDTLEKKLKASRAFGAQIKGPEIFADSDHRKAQVHYEILSDDIFVFEISGSGLISSLQIDDILDLETLPLGNMNLIPELTNRLRQHYLRKGYARVEIQTEVTVLPEARKNRVLFRVKEGSIVKLEKIQFQGRLSRKPDYYVRLLRQSGSDMIRRNFYLKEDLDQALEVLRKELQNQGYLLAQINSTRAIYNSNRDRINLSINLDEGQLTTIKSLIFENAKVFPQEVLTRVSGLQPGTPLQLTKIEESIKNLKNYYRDSGFLEMMVLNERQDLVQYNDDNSQATLVYRLFEGPQVKVASIVIEGLRKTREYVVRNELDFREGDLLTPFKINESIARLQRTGHFASVDIRTLEDKTEVADRTVLIRLTESDPGLFQMGFGLTNERDLTLRGYLGVGYRNIAGTGRGLSFRVDGNYYNVTDLRYLESRFMVGYLEPFLFDTRYKGRVNVTRSNSITDFQRERATIAVQQTWSIETLFTSHITGLWDVYARNSSEDFNVRGPRDREVLEIASTGFTLDFDYRDNLVRPRDGHQSRLNLEYGTPWMGSTKTIEYFRAAASYTHYQSFLEKKLTWSNGLRYGFLQNLSPRSDGAVPYDKKGFFLGGPATIRGFDPTTEAFPTSELLESVQERMTRQARMYLLRSTFSYPLFSIVDGTVFYDGGEVDVDGFRRTGDPDIDQGFGYRHAAGVGVLINTPVGPLNLEVGWKLDQQAGESPSAFHLSFGSF